MTDLPRKISVETVRTYRRTAITCAVLHGDAPYFNDCCVRAGLAAVVPLIRAQVAAEQPGYEPFVAAGPGERPLSNREFLDAEVERLGLQPKVDRLWAEVENGPPMPVGWCTWHQAIDCHGDAAECREARAEIAGGDGRG